MRFAHLADSHLGFSQLGIIEREEDYYELFERTIDKIIELDVDFVIHSGDLFDHYRPSTETLFAFQNALSKLKDAGIPFYAIAGNHDSRQKKNAKPPLVLFKDTGVKLISPMNKYYVQDGVLICGLPYSTSSQKKAQLLKLNELSDKAKEYSKSILVMHQGLNEFLPKGAGDLSIDELPGNFTYYAMGHLHNYILVDLSEKGNFSNGKLVYPGAMDVINTTESFNKGFCLVDLSSDVPQVEQIIMESRRKTYAKTIKYKNFDKELAEFKKEIQSLENKPVVDLTVRGGDFDSAEVYEILQNELKDHVLNLRIIYKPKKILDEEDSLNEKKPLDPKSLLIKTVSEKYEKQEVTQFAVELFEALAAKDMEDAMVIAEDYLNENYLDFEEPEVKKEDAGKLDAYF